MRRVAVGDGDNRDVWAFAGLVGLVTLVGGYFLDDALIGGQRPVPTHVVDVASAGILAAGVGILVVWTADIAATLTSGGGRRRVRVLAGSMGAVSGAALLANLGEFDRAARLFAENPDGATPLADPDRVLTLVTLGVAQVSEFFGTALFAAALAGPVVLALVRRLPLTANLTTLTIGAIGGAVAVAAFWFGRSVVELNERARDEGWYAATRVVYLHPAILGAVAGIVAGLGVRVAPQRRVALAGQAGAAGALVASTGAWWILGRSAVSFTFVLGEVWVFSLVGAFMIGAVLSDWRRVELAVPAIRWRAAAMAVLAGLVAAGALMAYGLSLVAAQPSVAEDRAYWIAAVDRTLNASPALPDRFAVACDRPVGDDDAAEVADLVEQFESPTIRPATEPVRAVYEQLLEAFETCGDALDRADRDDDLLSGADLAAIESAWQQFVADYNELFDADAAG